MRPAQASLPDPWKKPPKQPNGKPNGKPLRRPHRRTKPQLLTARDLDKRSNAYKAFTQLMAEIEIDLGGRDALSVIERQLIAAFVGAAITLQHFNTQLALGQKVDLAQFTGVASSMVRIAAKLGLRRRQREIEQTLDEYLRDKFAIDKDVAREEAP
jgi:hypothetical protein